MLYIVDSAKNFDVRNIENHVRNIDRLPLNTPLKRRFPMIVFLTIFLLFVIVISLGSAVSRSKNGTFHSVMSAASTSSSTRASVNPKEIDGRRVIGWEKYFEKHLYCRPDALKQFPPPHYDWEELPVALSKRLTEYVAPSYGVVDTYEEHVVFRLVYDVYSRAKELEKEKDYTTALDSYLLILFSVVPLGDSYYNRPAILLERFKQYEAAIIVCKMRYRYLGRDAGKREGAKEELMAEWKKRENRLKEKIKKRSVKNSVESDVNQP